MNFDLISDVKVLDESFRSCFGDPFFFFLLLSADSADMTDQTHFTAIDVLKLKKIKKDGIKQQMFDIFADHRDIKERLKTLIAEEASAAEQTRSRPLC